MSYKAICFDIDGTLYPASVMNRRLIAIWILHPFFTFKYTKARKLFRPYQASFKQDIPLRWREAMHIQNESAEEPSRPFSKLEYSKTYEKLQRRFYRPLERLYRKTRTFDGVRATFEKIKAKGLKIGVFTDFPLYDKLNSMGISDLVDFSASSDDIGFLKPDTHCFEYLLYNLKMEPKDVLYVGDSYDKDIVGASKAGIDSVLVNVERSELQDAKSRYPLAKAVFCRWEDFDAWLASGMEDR